MMLDTLEAHRIAFPDPPVSRRRAVVVAQALACIIPPRLDRKPSPQVDLTTARIVALAGHGPLAPETIGRIWAAAGVHASDPAAVLRYYHGTGAMVRVRIGRRGEGQPPPLYVVPGTHYDPSAVAHPGSDHGSPLRPRTGKVQRAKKASRPTGGGRGK